MNDTDNCVIKKTIKSCDVVDVAVKTEPITEEANSQMQNCNRPPPKILNGLLGKRKQPTLGATSTDTYKTPTLTSEPNAIRRLLVIRRHPVSLQPPPKELIAASSIASALLDTTHAPSPPPLPIANIKTQPPPTKLKLKVKCLCKLSQQSLAMELNTTSAEAKASSDFFALMYEQTLKLGHAQQRRIKMELLAALCEAEAHAEAGRCCALCCT